MSKIPFSKYSGCGNDFVLIDNREGNFPTENGQLIRNLCRRSLGIGADGIVLLENSSDADYRMRIFNPDGNEAEMCGNGLRCLGMYLKEIGIPGNSFHIEVTKKIYPIQIEGKQVEVSMAPPEIFQKDLSIRIDHRDYQMDYLDTGVPHVVLFDDHIEEIDVNELGSKIRHHPLFAPKGANVNFATLKQGAFIELRTFERGVEAETLACGTGSAAVAIAASAKWGATNPITVKTRSGECLEFNLKQGPKGISQILMKGPANQIYSGIVDIP